MFDAAHPAHLLAAAGAAGPAMDEHRQGEPWPVDSFALGAVEDHHPAVISAGAEDELPAASGE